MLNLSTHITLNQAVALSPNLTSRFSDEDLDAIGEMVYDGYSKDQSSRTQWMNRVQAGMDLALQLQKDKSFPWPGSSNVAFPLVTIAALQFHSRAYPALISGTDIVKVRTPAPDPTGVAQAAATLVSQYMSFQVLEEDQSWEEQHDRLLLQIAIIGCSFIKTRYDAGMGHNVSELVPAVNLVMDYYAKSVESCGRKTEVIPHSRNQVYEKCRSQVWRDITKEPWFLSPSMPMDIPGQPEANKRKGQTPPVPDEATPLVFLEQHVNMDLDGDGYQEPYVVCVEMSSKKVVRITARWDDEADVEKNKRGQVIRIRATEHYTKYGLIPSPDGGIYDMGFGILLGPLNESVNALVNQLIDAGTMANTAGGFLARGVKIRGGAYNFQPFGWNAVDSTGDDLRKGIVPLPVNAPSDVLFKLLSFLVDYTQRVGGATDATTGQNPGQNTPAGTQQSMVEQGMKIYSALFKRSWRSMKEEFSKLYILNAKYLPVSKRFGEKGIIGRENFLGDPSKIVPAADPNITSDQMRLQQAAAIAERAAGGGYDKEAVEKNLLAAMKVDNIEVLFPGYEKFPPPPNPKVAVVQMQTQSKEKIEQGKLQFSVQQALVELQAEQETNQARIINLMAQAQLFSAQAEGVDDGHQIEMINGMIALAKHHDEKLRGHIELAIRHMEAQAAITQAKKEPQGA